MTISYREIMTNAWTIAKTAAVSFGGKSSEYIAIALHMSWEAYKHPTVRVADRIPELEKLGFNHWQKGTMDRLYINARDLGLVCTYHKTGSEKDCWFNGTPISNCEARRMKSTKCFIDVRTELVYCDNRYMRDRACELSGCKAA